MANRKPKPAPEPERRGHPAMKFNAELADQFGIIPGADPPRELVQVASLPTPPPTDEEIVAGLTRDPSIEENSDNVIVNTVREEVEELSARLQRFGVRFDSSQQQTVVDYTLSVLSGYAGGGAIARRR